jgi:hypothetical protein
MHSLKRKNYEHVKNVLFPGSTPTMSQLRRELQITDGTTSYNFDFSKKSAGALVRETEILLESNEAFVAQEMALGILVVDPAAAKKNLGVVHSYPNPIEISKGWATPAGPAISADPLPANLEIMWLGSFKIQTDQDVVFERLPGSEFRVVPQTQLSAVNDFNQQTADDRFRELQPQMVIFEDKKNKFDYSLPTLQNLPVDSNNSGAVFYLVAELRGFLITPSDAKKWFRLNQGK